MGWIVILSVVAVLLALLTRPAVWKGLIVWSRMRIRNRKGELMKGAPPIFPSYFEKTSYFGRQMSKIYGRIYYIWHWFTPVIVLAEAEAIREYYKDHFQHARNSNFYCFGNVFKDMYGNCLAVIHGRHRARTFRGYFEPYFTWDYMQYLHDVMGEATHLWLKDVPVNEPLDFDKVGMIDVTFMTLIQLTYGEDVRKRHLRELQELYALQNEVLNQDTKAWSRTFLYELFPSSLKSRTREFMRRWLEFHKTLLEEREKGILTNTDSLWFTNWDRYRAGETSEMNEKELMDTTGEVVLLNVDSTHNATGFLLADLARHPDIQDKVLQELDTVLGGVDPCKVEDLRKQLPYFTMVMKESLRMHPGIGITFPETSTRAVTDVGGYLIPKGTIVCVDPYSINYDPEYWPDPEKFDPERFGPNGNLVPSAYFRFGLGPRKCIAFRVALSVTTILVATLLQRYRVELAVPGAEDKLKSQGMTVFTPYKAPDIILRPRQQEDS